MKKLSKIIGRHAQRHRDLLEQRWKETDLKAGEANQIIARIDGVLERLPVAIKQAHERIIGERKVSSKEKMLSLYEDHAAVYVRGKAGANVEFGSQLLLGERIIYLLVVMQQRSGQQCFIVYWQPVKITMSIHIIGCMIF